MPFVNSIVRIRRSRVLEARWQKLCSLYLPLKPKDSMWRYARAADRRGPGCGWKLHISATILNAPAILKRIAPHLIQGSVQFKAPRSLMDVGKINSGLQYSYSQIGKVITVYPRSDGEAIILAQRLHHLTRRFAGPSVPFDLRLTDGSNVYYRYGAFERVEIEHANGSRTLGLRLPSGELVPDVRERAKPDWARDPFVSNRPVGRKRKDSQAIPFRVLRALVQRGKGGVYQAVDLTTTPPRLCLLKEGRRNGEVNWDGRDGAWRIRHEKRVLSLLAACGIDVPKVYSSFALGDNYYLAMEFIDGESLHNLLLLRQKRLPVAQVLKYGAQLATFLSQMHGAGWAWRDCKPKNIIVTPERRLRPLDFEGAARVDRPDPVLWGTPGFTPPKGRNGSGGIGDDLYALGSILYLLLTGRVFDGAERPIVGGLRPNVPMKVCRLVEQLLSHEPEHRPTAKAACAQIRSSLLRIDKQDIRRRNLKARLDLPKKVVTRDGKRMGRTYDSIGSSAVPAA